MFDIEAFVQGWPTGSIPNHESGLQPIPPRLGPEDRDIRRQVRDDNVEQDLIWGGEEAEIFKRYIAGTATPAECWQLHRLNGWVSVDKDIDAGGLAMLHAELDLVQDGISLDMPTRLLGFRYTTDDDYSALAYAGDVRRHADQTGNSAMRLFIDVQQHYEVRLRPVVAYADEQDRLPLKRGRQQDEKE